MALEKAIDAKHDQKNKKHERIISAEKKTGDRLVCVRCGIAVEVDYPLLESSQEEVGKRLGFHSQSHRIILYGYCQDCTCNLN
jgi:Fe2+ or Zn2+ uptake regulation protein